MRPATSRIHFAANARQIQQFIEQLAHLVRRSVHVGQILLDPLLVRTGHILLQVAEEGFQRHQRAFQVVRHGVGEAFQFGVFLA